MSNQVLAFKLLSGEEVIAEVLSQALNPVVTSWNLRRPHVLRFHPVGPGQMGLAFVPLTLSNPNLETLRIEGKSLLFAPFEVSVEVEKQYLQQTSGIALAVGGSPIVT